MTRDLCEQCGTGELVNAYEWGHDDMHLCNECATEFGFCTGCGQMAAGANDDYLARHGICYDCMLELRIETGEFDEWDDSGFEY